MARIYFYKMTNDDGTAPCVADGLLTLCLCKPAVRSTAMPGDCLIGFAANSLHADNRLIYVARITEKETGGDYFSRPVYRSREDCIYERRDSAFVLRRGARHHTDPGHLEHDLGRAPEYARANSLLSRKFRYFGTEGTDRYKQQFPLVARAVAALRQGHRVNHRLDLERALAALVEWCFAMKQPMPMPSAGRNPGRCGAERNGRAGSAVRTRRGKC